MMGTFESNELVQVTLYTKPGCHLCDDLLEELRYLNTAMRFKIEERNIERSAADFDRFKLLVPVLQIPGEGLLYPPHDPAVVQNAIASAIRQQAASHE